LIGDTDSDKVNYEVWKHTEDFHSETRLKYKTKDGYTGWIISIKKGKKPKK